MSHEEIYVAQGGGVKTKKHYCRQRATVAVRQQCSNETKKPALPSAFDMIYPLQSRGAHCPVRQLLPAATAVLLCAVLLYVLPSMLLRDDVGCVLTMGCVLGMGCVLAVSCVAHVSQKIYKGVSKHI